MTARTAVPRCIDRLRVVLPTLTTAALRLTLLLVLVALTTSSRGAEQSALVAGFALLSSFAMVFDSGAGNFLLSAHRADVTTGLHRRVTLLQGCLSTLGLVAATSFVLATTDGVLFPASVAVLAALGVSQLLDGVAWVARAPFLVAGGTTSTPSPTSRCSPADCRSSCSPSGRRTSPGWCCCRSRPPWSPSRPSSGSDGLSPLARRVCSTSSSGCSSSVPPAR